MPNNVALGVRRNAQACMLRRLEAVDTADSAATRARAEARMRQRVAENVVQERRGREEEAARRAAVLAS
jgi:hypothetical protein